MYSIRRAGALTLGCLTLCANSWAAAFVAEVLSYTPGTFDLHDAASTFTDPAAAIGSPNPVTGAATPYPSILSPFSPPYESTDLVSIGSGGQITLRMANYVTIDRNPNTFELGVFENVGLSDIDGNGTTGTPAEVFGPDSAVVEVSADGVTWYALNSGQPILFTLPTNYYANASSPYQYPPPAPAVLADFGKPFTGSLADFDGKSFTQVLGVLNGSAGGTWLNLDALPSDVTQIGYVRFSGVAAGQSFDLDAVSINSALAGAETSTPEPTSIALLLTGFAFIGAMRLRDR